MTEQDVRQEPVSDDELREWHEPDGSAAEVGLHPHYALWDHEGQQWDPLPPDFPALLAQKEALVTALRKARAAMAQVPYHRPEQAEGPHREYTCLVCMAINLADETLDALAAASDRAAVKP